MSRIRPLGWGRLFVGSPVIWVMSAIALVSLTAGFVLANLTTAPSELKAPPSAGLITAAVERTILTSEVVFRGDASLADTVEITASSSDSDASPVVTSVPPAPGTGIDALSVPIEVSGRPVIVLPGLLPAYRTLKVGLSGPDVAQLKTALAAVGIDPGDPGSDTYDTRLAQAVGALYERVGYDPPAPDDGAADAVFSARAGAVAAELGVDVAQRQLDAARRPIPESERLSLESGVAQAQRAVAAATRAHAVASPMEQADTADGVAEATEALALAEATRAAALAAADTSEQSDALAAARQDLTIAQRALAQAEVSVAPTLPVGEVVFLTELPRQVNTVTARQGAPATGVLLTVSGAELSITGSVSATDAALMTAGTAGTFQLPDGEEVPCSVSSVLASVAEEGTGDPEQTVDPSGNQSGGSTSDQFSVTLTPAELTPAQIAAVDGTNVRVTIAVGSSSGEVLAVPLAAVSDGPGGVSRVEVASKDDSARFVEVTVGLAGSGLVEIRPVTKGLAAGDKVVVGR